MESDPQGLKEKSKTYFVFQHWNQKGFSEAL